MPRDRAAILGLGWCVLCVGPSVRAQDGPATHPTLEDIFSVKVLGSIALSPDGRHVLYTVTASDLDANTTNSEVWMVPADGSAEPVQLTRNPGSDSRPAWRPDGSAFVFVSARGTGAAARPALYLMRPFGGGEPERLYSHETGIGQFSWSPDGRFIAFTAGDEESQDAKDRKKLGRDSEIEDESDQYRHLWILDVESRQARRVTQGTAFTVQAFSWHPDSRRIAFWSTPNLLPYDSWKSDIFVVDALEASPAPRRLTTNPRGDFHPMWTPDGQWIVYRTRHLAKRSLTNHKLFRIPADGGAFEDISPKADLVPSIEAGYLTGYVFAPDGRHAFFGATTGTTEGLFAMPLDTREPIRLTPDSGVYEGASFSLNRQTVAFLHESPDEPPEIYAAEIDISAGGSRLTGVRQLTSHNEHAKAFAVGKTEVVRWKSRDGREIEGLVVLPAGWSHGDGPRALVTNIHGGPAQVRVQSFQAAGFDTDAQRYAADGYAVFLPNPRGSSGYSEESLLSIREDWGGRDFQDIMTGIDYLIDRGIAHRDSLGVMGWSYGGYMTAWAVTQTRRFKAAVAGAPITDILSQWGSTVANIHLMIEDYFRGGPYEPGRWKVYQRSNPMPFVTQVTTPTLVIQGKNDPTVTPDQARTFFRALRANGVPTKLVWLPRTGHWPGEPGLGYEAARHQKEWLDRWVRGEGDVPN